MPASKQAEKEKKNTLAQKNQGAEPTAAPNGTGDAREYVVTRVQGLEALDGEGPATPSSTIEDQLRVLTEMLQKQQQRAAHEETDAPSSPNKSDRWSSSADWFFPV